MLCPGCLSENDPAAKACATCRTVLPPGLEGSLAGGRYQIQSCLGQGGMGVVYKAYDRVLEETVAIKVLLGRAGADPGAARRFRSEIGWPGKSRTATSAASMITARTGTDRTSRCSSWRALICGPACGEEAGCRRPRPWLSR
jgi:hypothetical protein